MAAQTDPMEKKMKNLSIPSGLVQEKLLQEIFVMLIPFLSGVYFNLPSNSPQELMYIYGVFKGWVHINYGISVNSHFYMCPLTFWWTIQKCLFSHVKGVDLRPLPVISEVLCG